MTLHRTSIKDTTSAMMEEEFKAELTRFAGHVEQKQAHGILIDVAQFRHRPGPDMQEWRVRRFAFLFPTGAPIPPMIDQSAFGEGFATRAFSSEAEAIDGLSGAGGK